VARSKRIEYEAFFPSAAGSDALPEAKRIPLEAVDQNPEQPRTGPLEGIEDLAASIAEYGLLQPIVVSPAAAGRHTCIAGHRRLAAYRWLAAHHPERDRWAAIPALERAAAGDEWLALALLENMSRADLTEPEIITGLRLLHDLRGWSQARIATKLGVSRQRISQYFRVAGDAAVAELVQTGRVSVAKAYDVLLARSPDAKRAALAVARQGAPQRVIRQVARGAPGHAPSGFPGEPERAGEAAETTTTGLAPVGGVTGGGTPPSTDGVGEPSPGSGRGTGGQAGQTDCRATDPSAADTAPEGGPHAGHGWRDAESAGPVATAAPDAGARDLAELAGALGVVVRSETLQLTHLLLNAASAGGGVDARAFLRLARADVRQVEAAIRAAAAR
jgi:ParB/RepB/Spo0J family partition protein